MVVARDEMARSARCELDFQNFLDNSQCTQVYFFLPLGSSESPTPAGAKGAGHSGGFGWWVDGCVGVWMGAWVMIKRVF